MEKIKRMFDGRINRGKYFLATLLLDIPREIIVLTSSTKVMKVLICIVIGFFILSLTVRRLHDIGHRGTMGILSIIPGINEILLIVLFLKKGDPEENLYGPVPN